MADEVSLGSNMDSGRVVDDEDAELECDTDDVPLAAVGLTDMESIIGLIIWPNELKHKQNGFPIGILLVLI